jgi:DNA-binding SARP family transcriptional activator/tetratricopeptide (TPR) repeat protein
VTDPAPGPARVELLGPLRLGVAAPLQGVPAEVVRSVLGALVLAQSAPVSAARLLDTVWGELPPNDGPAALQAAVSRLRAWLRRHRLPLPVRLGPAGYRIDLAGADLDLVRFRELAARARTAAGAERLRLLGRAAGLWRGPVLDDVPAHRRDQAAVVALTRERLDVLVGLAASAAEAGAPGAAVPELQRAAADHPLDERLHAALVRTLAAAGSPSAAADAYRQVRERLTDELGVEPGAELRDAARRPAAGRPVPPAPRRDPDPVPRLLPGDLADFTGRAGEVAELTRILDRPAGTGAVSICVVDGAAGVGKTALAVHVAQRLRDRFPGGQLYVDLHGVGDRPVGPGQALGRFLRVLGVPGRELPDAVEERAELYRSRLGDRRVLVVLDDAAAAGQVRPLLPGGPGSAVLVTARRRVPGLAGARALHLDLLEPDAAVALLDTVAGPGRVAGDPAAGRWVVALCGRLPLAVRIAGARLAARPHWSVGELARLLADERRRLDELVVADLDLRASLALSYRGLDPAAARALRLLGLPDAPVVAGWVVAALLDVPVEEGGRIAEELTDAALLDAERSATGQVRYRMHDLVRLFARERGGAEDSPAERRSALERAFGGWLGLAESADARLPAGSLGAGSGPAARWGPARWRRDGPARDPAEWFGAELPTLVAVVRQAAATGLVATAWDLAGRLAGYCDLRGHWEEWRSSHEAALAAAVRAGDRSGTAHSLFGLARAAAAVDDYARAAGLFRRAAALFAELEDRGGQAYALNGLGGVLRWVGEVDEALDCLEGALALIRGLPDRRGEGYLDLDLGLALRDLGRLAEAARALDRSLDAFADVDDPAGRHAALRARAAVHRLSGRPAEAEADLRAALRFFEAVGDRRMVSYLLRETGQLRLAGGDHTAPEDLLPRALAEAVALRDVPGEALTRHVLGDLRLAQGRRREAAEQLERAVALATEVDMPLGRARMLVSLAAVRSAEGAPDAAAGALREAHAIFERLGSPEAAEVAARLRPRGRSDEQPTGTS